MQDSEEADDIWPSSVRITDAASREVFWESLLNFLSTHAKSSPLIRSTTVNLGKTFSSTQRTASKVAEARAAMSQMKISPSRCLKIIYIPDCTSSIDEELFPLAQAALKCLSQRCRRPQHPSSVATANDQHELGQAIFQELASCLERYLEDFGEKCCRRGVLHGLDWMRRFTSLCGFSIIKSTLIDARDRDRDAQSRLWQPSAVARINSLYKVLVNLFSWASYLDPLCTGYETLQKDSKWSYLNPQIMDKLLGSVQRDRWEERGITSTKNFLVGLGSGFYKDGTYNGYYVQQYGLESARKALRASQLKILAAREKSREKASGADANLHEDSDFNAFLNASQENL
ncbi:MAG: hypothetical protein M1818_003401 [Claussenomyces sp. TS43310]|nr:MAG: hypothetical protein M1818_003401 [Claussenomyces sp. TS43310]